MSVLVKGMEMPKTCEECAFGYEEDVAWMACIPQGVSVRKESVSGICEPHCPLIEVPAPHGDLIDIDSKITVAIKDGLKVTTARKLLNDRAVRLPKTVIEAEDGDTN